MNIILIVSLGLSVLLLAYLVFVMFFPEKF
jgi:K+-transporting ATPase KdpF subunit